jgi:hypothetical protein
VTCVVRKEGDLLPEVVNTRARVRYDIRYTIYGFLTQNTVYTIYGVIWAVYTVFYLFIYLLGGLESVGLARPPYM